MQKIYKKLYQWYQKEGRHTLPWRTTKNPYEIYVSEIMLQQTQVKTVLERYYFPFLEKFPTLQHLADAPLDEVLKMWEGLGYYTRAKNLHKSAQLCAPTLPKEYEALLKLPGIGKNTASAICAFAYGQKRAVMEANVKRVLCRIYALKNPKENLLLEKASYLLDEAHPFDYNQAMMDLGAMVCTPKEPQCQECAFEEICQAKVLKCYDFPQKRARKVPTKKEIVVVHIYKKSVALMQRKGRFLHGLWGFAFATQKEGERVGMVKHQYSHFKLEVEVYVKRDLQKSQGMYDVEEIETLALSSVDQKILHLIKAKGFTSRR